MNTPRRRHLGFSLMESMIAILVLSFVGVLAMEAAGTSARAQKSLAERQLADRLADGLLAEIMSRAFPERGTTVSATTRGSFRLVADYANFVESPPKLRSGGPLSFSGGAAGLGADWQRKVDLAFVNPSDPDNIDTAESGLYRITVTVSRGGVVLSRRVGLRARD